MASRLVPAADEIAEVVQPRVTPPVRSMSAVSLRLDNTYARDLPGFSVPWRPEAAPAPKSLFFNAELAEELGLDAASLAGDAGAALFAGNTVPEGAEPI